jgi:hypothetical protein
MKNKVETSAANAASKPAPTVNVEGLPTIYPMAKAEEHVIGDDETPEVARCRKAIQKAATTIAEKSKIIHDAIVEAVEEHGVSRETIIQWVEDTGYSNSRARDLVAKVWIDAKGKATSGKKKGSTKNPDLVQAMMKYARSICSDDAEASKTLRAAQRQIDAARKAANVVEMDKAA